MFPSKLRLAMVAMSATSAVGFGPAAGAVASPSAAASVQTTRAMAELAGELGDLTRKSGGAPIEGWAYRRDQLLVKLSRVPGTDLGSVRVLADLRTGSAGSVLGGLGVSVTSPFAIAPANGVLASTFGLDRWVLVSVPQGMEVELAAERVRAVVGVELVEFDGLGGTTAGPIPAANDLLLASQWYLNNTGQTVLGQVGTANADIDGVEAWGSTRGASSVIVAVLDTGVSLSHPDLAGKLLSGFNAMSSTGSWDDNFNLSHGTFCSGIIAANTNNLIGIAGIAPDCKVLPVKVLNGSFGSESTVASGLVWATDRGASVANMSLSFPQGSTLFRDAVLYAYSAGVVLVSSTGNNPTAAIGYPAKWDVVIAVGATDNRDVAASFETTGPEMDLCAPGVGIMTTTDMVGNADGYSLQSGTSMAAPMVAGTAALMRSVNPRLSPEQIAQILRETAVDRGAVGWDSAYGAGRLNAQAAVLRAMSTQPNCFADWNGDGTFDSNDIFEYLNSWFAGDADVNNDGITTADDIFSFLNGWFSVCR